MDVLPPVPSLLNRIISSHSHVPEEIFTTESWLSHITKNEIDGIRMPLNRGHDETSLQNSYPEAGFAAECVPAAKWVKHLRVKGTNLAHGQAPVRQLLRASKNEKNTADDGSIRQRLNDGRPNAAH